MPLNDNNPLWWVGAEYPRAICDATAAANRQLSTDEKREAWVAHEAKRKQIVNDFHARRIPRNEALAWLGRYFDVWDVNLVLYGNDVTSLRVLPVTAGELETACVQHKTAWPGDYPPPNP